MPANVVIAATTRQNVVEVPEAHWTVKLEFVALLFLELVNAFYVFWWDRGVHTELGPRAQVLKGLVLFHAVEMRLEKGQDAGVLRGYPTTLRFDEGLSIEQRNE